MDLKSKITQNYYFAVAIYVLGCFAASLFYGEYLANNANERIYNLMGTGEVFIVSCCVVVATMLLGSLLLWQVFCGFGQGISEVYPRDEVIIIVCSVLVALLFIMNLFLLSGKYAAYLIREII